MNNIPEDSVLRRHYLTELRNKQAEQAEQAVTREWSNMALFPVIAFLFFMCIMFL